MKPIWRRPSRSLDRMSSGFFGRMEFGPAPWGEEYSADARSDKCRKSESQNQIPRVVPPFAPAVLMEYEYFQLTPESLICS